MSRVVLLAAVATGSAAVAAFVALALVHVGDNYHVDHVAGAWMGLAAYADHGVLYPPLYDDGHFGGTRYGPLGIVLNTAAARVTGEYLVSGKVVALLTMGALLAAIYVAARGSGAARPVSFAAVGAAIATFTVSFAGTTIYGDVLAAALQLWALALVSRRLDRRTCVLAGVLAGLAVTAKITAVWGGLAVLVWLAVRARRQVPSFVAGGMGTAATVFGLAALASHGRIAENVLGLGGSGLGSVHHVLVDTLSKTWEILEHNAQATLILMPIAALALGLSVAARTLQITDVALVLAAGVTLVVLTDVGTGFNHLLDVAVLVPLTVAGAHSRIPDRPAVVLVAMIALATAVSLFDARHDVGEAARTALHLRTPERLRAPALPGRLAEPYFTEDASLAVERGQRPVALDSFMLLRILRDHPEYERELIARFDRHEFRTVVLFMDLDLHDRWWSGSHLGLDVARAIDRNYRFAGKVRGPVFAYRLFVPVSGSP